MKKLIRPLVVVACSVGVGLLAPACGRTLSRFGLGAQNLRAPEGAIQVLNIAFHKSGETTVKDVVFVMRDCTVVAKEYRDASPFEGQMRILTNDGKPFKQAGCVPR